MTGLYQSGWSPPRTPASWERCSMDLPSALRAYGAWVRMVKESPEECVAWFDEDGACRLVAFTFKGTDRVAMIRHLARTTKVTFARTAIAKAEQSDG